MSKRVILKDLCGDFCTERKHPQMPLLQKWVGDALLSGEEIVFDRHGLKMLSVSFIDELLPPFAVQVGLERVMEVIRFEPPLEQVFHEQIKRGIRLRAP